MISIFHTSVMRNLRKGKFHLILNIAGLALGLAAFLYIATYIFYEISYDRFHTKSDRIYRCVAFLKLGDVATNFAKSEIPLAQAALNDLPEVEEATRLVQLGNTIVRQNDQKFIEDEAWYADANIFKVFDFKLLIGDENSALSKPNSIVLTEEAAIKYFGSVNPIGKSLGIGENNSPYQVTGILDKIPENSHLQFEMLASFSSFLENRKGDLWGDFTATYTYLLIKEGTDMNRFYPKFKIFPEKYWGPMIENSLGKTLKEFEKSGNYLRYELQPLSKVHLNTTFSEELKNHGNYRILLILGITGLFILIIACFNFINLSTAQASLRAKEIGLKKIIGSLRNQLISQLLFETFIYSLIALVLAVGFLFIFIPLLNSFSGINMPNSYILNRFTLLTVATVPFIVTFLAGSYPAFYLTRFQPGEVINRKICMGKTKSNLRGGLVTFQFVVFIILIFSTVVIRKQLFFLQHQNPGFNKENVLVVKNTSRLNNSRLAYKNTLLDNTHIISGSFASKLPSVDDNRTNLFCQKGSQEKFLMNRLYVDLDFENTLNTKMVVGRFFSDQLTTETNYAIINEEAARLLGWSDCNDKILYDFNNGGRDFKVIGIMKNFHLRSMREKPAPVVIRLSDQEEYLALRVKSGGSESVLNYAKSQWDIFNKYAPFEYFFLDENFDAQYKKEEQLGKLIGVFTVIAILIACFGLFGLVSFASVQRQKEIGIRKVNGAKIFEILTMLNKDFVKWVVVAFVIATPIAYYAMNKWLENFAYKTNLSWWIFAVAGLLALGIALLTVSWQSLKAATRNPVEALRYE